MNDDDPKTQMIALFTKIHNFIQRVEAGDDGEEEAEAETVSAFIYTPTYYTMMSQKSI